MSKLFNPLIWIVSIITVSLIVSCQEKDASYKIEEEVMVSILLDIHVGEAATQQGDVSQRDSLRILYYNQIFEIHEVSKKVYEEDMELLKRDAEKLAELYDKVIERLKERKAEL